eukprot:CAMPEP_0174711870 /NCGR_PEP_ID=MMETSP1094-20130205/13058_1 /TAXON_ID=156173 /ORGANISM="Chrysochromulina brevifilum, Strain UTEX LB 985" /LENGTH=264 /DNA_ID=CAMNT_0015910869 /DNA_START=20 /DNA_END=814 /DNA_ORIENTATION=-
MATTFIEAVGIRAADSLAHAPHTRGESEAEAKRKAMEEKIRLFETIANGELREDVLLPLITPNNAKVMGPDRYTPLHMIVMNGAKTPAALVAALVQAYPAAAKRADVEEKTPLHLAAENGASEAVISVLVEACPEAAIAEAEWHQTPLHLGLERGVASEAAILALLNACPEAAKVKTDCFYKSESGKYPLHWAALNLAPEAVVSALLTAYPEAAKQQCDLGLTPLGLVNKYGLTVVDMEHRRPGATAPTSERLNAVKKLLEAYE